METGSTKSRTWKRVVREIAIMALLVVVISNIISFVRQPALTDSQLPRINERLINGETFRAKDFRSKPLLIHFWATWCPVCKAEADNIERLSAYYEIVTFAVKSGSDEELQRYMRERGMHYRVINDRDGRWAEEFNVQGFPTSFVYDSKGNLSSSTVGYTSTAGLALRMWWAD